MMEFGQDVGNLVAHSETESALGVFPFEIDDGKLVASPILGHFVVFLEKISEVINVAFADVFDTKVIDYEAEENG